MQRCGEEDAQIIVFGQVETEAMLEFLVASSPVLREHWLTLLKEKGGLRGLREDEITKMILHWNNFFTVMNR